MLQTNTPDVAALVKFVGWIRRAGPKPKWVPLVSGPTYADTMKNLLAVGREDGCVCMDLIVRSVGSDPNKDVRPR